MRELEESDLGGQDLLLYEAAVMIQSESRPCTCRRIDKTVAQSMLVPSADTMTHHIIRGRIALLCLFALLSCSRSDRAGVVSHDGGLAREPDGGANTAFEELSAGQVETILDPYGVAPLSAVVNVHGVSPESVRFVSITVAGKDGDDLRVTLRHDDEYDVRYACPERLDTAEDTIQVPILGLYPDFANTVHLEIHEDSGVRVATITIVTPPLLVRLPTIHVVTADTAKMEPGWNLAGFFAAEGEYRPRPFMFDRHGRVRWVLLVDKAFSTGFVTPMDRLRNGNLIMGSEDSVVEYSMLGRQVHRWALPVLYSQDHDVFEMPDGNLLVCGASSDLAILNSDGQTLSPSAEVIEIDRQSGAVRNIWDLSRFLDVDRYTYIKTGQGQDWFHLNSVIYDPSDDSIIVSGKHQGVAKISRGGVNLDDPYAGKQLRWILAPHAGWEKAGWDGTGIDLAPYLLNAVDETGALLDDATQFGTASSASFGWPYSQHAPMLLPGGLLFMFDNGSGRDLGTYAGAPFSRGVAYQIHANADGVGGTVRQVWEYGRARGPQLYSPVISNVDEGPVTGNRFVNPGSYTTQDDGTPGGVAKMVEVRPTDGSIVFESHLHMRGLSNWGSDLCYRQRRQPIYW